MITPDGQVPKTTTGTLPAMSIRDNLVSKGYGTLPATSNIDGYALIVKTAGHDLPMAFDLRKKDSAG